jgi:hypothetical protein
MKFLLSKGLIYNISDDKLLTIYHNGELIKLNKSESLIWNECSWNPKNYEELIKKNINSIDFSLTKLIKKNLIFISEKESLEDCLIDISLNCKFKLLNISIKNKLKSFNYKHIIKDIKFYNNLTSFDKMVYNYLKDYNNEISVSDIILIIDNGLFNIDYFTDGYTQEYINIAKKSKSSKKVTQSIFKLLSSKLIYTA